MDDMMQEGPIFVDVMGNEAASSEFVIVQPTEGQAADEDNEKSCELPKSSARSKPDVYPVVQKRRIRCPECKRYTAENEEKMQRHIRKVHRGENPFQCSMCDYSTYNKSMFEEHVRIHQGIKPFKCTKCPYRSVSKKNTKKHELIHRPNNPLKCSQCDFIARHSRSLVNHLRGHGGAADGGAGGVGAGGAGGVGADGAVTSSTVKCDKCEKSFSPSDDHGKAVEECSRCDFTACTRSVLTQHMLKVHGEGKKKRLLEALFVCSICSWSSRSRPRILLHLIHHPNQCIDEKVLDVSVLRKHGILS